MKPLNFMETLFLLDALGVENIGVKALINAFYEAVPLDEPKEEEQPKKAYPGLKTPPEPPKPAGLMVYKDYSEAKKAAQKGQETVHDANLGGYVNV